MDASEYRRLMEQQVNTIWSFVLGLALGAMGIWVFVARYGFDVYIPVAVIFTVAAVVYFGLLYWWNASVLPRVREMEQGKSH
jgi:hypothetical protein